MAAYEVTVSSSFVARHSVRAPGGEMEGPHEHDWQVTAAFRADALDENGFVVDFLVVQQALAGITDKLGGTDLNQAVPECPGGVSAERLAEHVAQRLQCKVGREVYCLRVSEAPGCTAAYYPGGGMP